MRCRGNLTLERKEFVGEPLGIIAESSLQPNSIGGDFPFGVDRRRSICARAEYVGVQLYRPHALDGIAHLIKDVVSCYWGCVLKKSQLNFLPWAAPKHKEIYPNSLLMLCQRLKGSTSMLLHELCGQCRPIK